MPKLSKEQFELQVFKDFAGNHLSGADLASARNRVPPEPDIFCQITGQPHYFELAEITDEDLARSRSESLRTGAETGGSFSQESPLLRIIRSKVQKTYVVGSVPLDLLLYYHRQYPFEPALLSGPKSPPVFQPSGIFSSKLRHIAKVPLIQNAVNSPSFTFSIELRSL